MDRHDADRIRRRLVRHRALKSERARRKLLGRFELDDQLERSIAETGMLELRFGHARPDATMVSADGNRTIVWLSPSGEIAAVLVQDYVAGEHRIIRFAFGDLEIGNDGATISAFLHVLPVPAVWFR